MASAEEVRQNALKAFIQRARRRGGATVAFTSTGIHGGMALQVWLTLVRSSIEADKLLEFVSGNLARCDGPNQSSTVGWVLELMG